MNVPTFQSLDIHPAASRKNSFSRPLQRADMVFNPNPTIHSFDTTADFVEYLLRGDAATITLIVCSTREEFLGQLCASIEHTALENEHGEHDIDRPWPLSNPRVYNTIGLIASSKRVTVAYCPSLEHYRAYISVFRRQTTSQQQLKDSSQYQGRPMLAILGLVALHCATAEFSAQGISKTFSLTVEVAAREKLKLALCEDTAIDREDENASAGSLKLWDADVPLLSGQIRGTGEGRTPTGRTVKVKQIARRWFSFV
ncbi:hypothetical protein AJ79_07786 [Helicocarpus griseus UAMH5409]|uniref:Uncharacterized protein n=1 Tax=Helicocarpus griseus UAMH5409 TaxID=1447875 RepID=A0A2B7WZ25_9EURO|nr:hypothetical protein AJ79_07786 [Helicocarpus griseus UAMH5409]